MNKNLIDIFKYFGNKDFERVNADREFTIDELLSIMMHSEEVGIEERADDLKVLATHADAETRARIERCIDAELGKLDIIKNTKADDTKFVSYGNDIIGTYLNKKSTFDEMMASGVNNEVIFINTYNDPEHRSSSIANFTVKNGAVTDTFVVSVYDNDADRREFVKTEVALASPFKTYDLINVRGKHYIVADTEAQCEVREREPKGWLNVTIPVYKVADDGTVTIDVVHKVPWKISEIRKLNAKYITLADIEQIEYIKEHLA